MSAKRLESIKQRLAAATPGPWERRCYDSGNSIGVKGMPGGPINRSNADFIAHTPEDIAWLLAEVERLGEDFSQAQTYRRSYGHGDAAAAGKRIAAMMFENRGKVGIGVIEQFAACEVQAMIDAAIAEEMGRIDRNDK